MTSKQITMKAKSWNDCCEELAKKWGLPDMKSLISQGRPYYGNLDSFFEKAADDYAEERIKEARGFWSIQKSSSTDGKI